jgi:hypothetical protein
MSEENDMSLSDKIENEVEDKGSQIFKMQVSINKIRNGDIGDLTEENDILSEALNINLDEDRPLKGGFRVQKLEDGKRQAVFCFNRMKIQKHEKHRAADVFAEEIVRSFSWSLTNMEYFEIRDLFEQGDFFLLDPGLYE